MTGFETLEAREEEMALEMASRRMFDWIRHYNICTHFDMTRVPVIPILKAVRTFGLRVDNYDVRPSMTAVETVRHLVAENARGRQAWLDRFKEDLIHYVRMMGTCFAIEEQLLEAYQRRVYAARLAVINATTDACKTCTLSLSCLTANWRTRVLDASACLHETGSVRKCTSCACAFELAAGVFSAPLDLKLSLDAPIMDAGGFGHCPRAVTDGYCPQCGGWQRALEEQCARLKIWSPP